MEINIGIDESKRKEISDGLKKLLADTYSLYLKTHNYHWNVTGNMFQTLHLLFAQHYNEMWTAVDHIAERIRSLGFFAPGTYHEFVELTRLKDDEDVPNANQMLRNLVEGHEAVVETIRDLFKIAEEADDQATLDILTQRISIHEKTAWMLRSFLQ